jgi:hypothetical protein
VAVEGVDEDKETVSALTATKFCRRNSLFILFQTSVHLYYIYEKLTLTNFDWCEWSLLLYSQYNKFYEVQDMKCIVFYNECDLDSLGPHYYMHLQGKTFCAINNIGRTVVCIQTILQVNNLSVRNSGPRSAVCLRWPPAVKRPLKCHMGRNRIVSRLRPNNNSQGLILSWRIIIFHKE